MTQLNAFVARSFAPQDEGRIRPVLQFLDTFRGVGFFWETAEAAEVMSVSEKVRRMIDEKDVFIGFFTRRYPVYTFSPGLRGAFQVAFGKLSPRAWSAPAWVLQESGYALRGKKKLILLREPEVEVFGLQGDLEYISFDSDNPAQVFPRLSEMINGLLAKAAGTEIKVTVSEMTANERSEAMELAVESLAKRPEEKSPRAEGEEADLFHLFFQMSAAAGERDSAKLHQAWVAGKKLTGDEDARFDGLAWDCLYHEFRFEMGSAEALETLRGLRAENPERPEPTLALARCLAGDKEFDQSARLFLEAANLQQGGEKVRSLISAAAGLRESGRYVEGIRTIEEALTIAWPDVKEEAISTKYQLQKASGDAYDAFATAELALYDNPNFSLRFGLALDYYYKGMNELAFHHFRFLHDHNEKDSSALHNLSLLCAECKLPIAAVSHYKLAFKMGNTHSAANLGYMYLDCGMADEATALIGEAMKAPEHNPRVEKCLAETIERREAEQGKQDELLKIADRQRGFLADMGRALTAVVPPIQGQWKFPFGEMPLSVSSGVLSGSMEVTREDTSRAVIGQILGGSKPAPRIERYILKGPLTGAVCRFELTVTELSEYPAITGLWGQPGPKSGFIVFADDGRRADYVEVADGKLGQIEKLTRAQ
jgi:tetratricopeptide (TPR) repeat protein